MSAPRTAEEIEALCARLAPLMPDKAAEIRRMLADFADGRRADLPRVELSVRYRLEKFDGDYEAGKAPVEVLEGEG